MVEIGLGVLIAIVGLYFIVCAAWAREFPLYKLKAAPLESMVGKNVHGYFIFLRVIALLMGIGKIAFEVVMQSAG